mmetsp:Transcript_1035/g.2958  ORF Transcript_1035/g.2958 Transcript_1035/m.2958 type:complete len:219 (+) Transcript_1035:1906-2562(+)
MESWWPSYPSSSCNTSAYNCFFQAISTEFAVSPATRKNTPRTTCNPSLTLHTILLAPSLVGSSASRSNAPGHANDVCEITSAAANTIIPSNDGTSAANDPAATTVTPLHSIHHTTALTDQSVGAATFRSPASGSSTPAPIAAATASTVRSADALWPPSVRARRFDTLRRSAAHASLTAGSAWDWTARERIVPKMATTTPTWRRTRTWTMSLAGPGRRD